MEAPSTPQRDNHVLRSAVNFQNGLPVGLFLHYLHMSIREVIAQLSPQRQILAARRCSPSSGDHLAPQCLLLRTAPVPPPPAASAICLGSVERGLSSTKLNSCIFIIIESTWALLPPTFAWRSVVPALRAAGTWAGTGMFSLVVWSITGTTPLLCCWAVGLVKVETEPC